MKKLLFALIVSLLSCAENAEKSKPEILILPQSSGTKTSFRGIAVRNDQEAWVSGTAGTVLKTTNGGTTWVKVMVPDSDSLDFRDIEILSENEILLMSAGSGTASQIYKSKDSGASWQQVHINTHSRGFFNGFDFWNDKSGILIGDEIDAVLYLLKTTDGGETWSRIGKNVLPPLFEGEYGFAASGTGITTFGNHKVWIATGGAAARVFYSYNGGDSWQVSETHMVSGKPSTGGFSIVFKDENNGVAVGGDYAADSLATGNAIYTHNGGKSWSSIDSPESLPFKSCVVHLQGSTFLATGTSGTSVSYDDGKSWSAVDDTAFHTIDFDQKSGTGWLAGGEGRVARFTLKKR